MIKREFAYHFSDLVRLQVVRDAFIVSKAKLPDCILLTIVRLAFNGPSQNFEPQTQTVSNNML